MNDEVDDIVPVRMGFKSVQVSCFFTCLLLASSFNVISAVQDNSVRLVNTYNSVASEGRLEIYHNGEWGTVCDDYFDNNVNAATVVCKMLGYTFGGHVTLNSPYGLGSGRVWLDDVICTGTESSIDDCVHLSWGSGNCGHGEDVAVKCAGTSLVQDNSVRLVNTYNSIASEGRLEIYHNGEWGTVCDDYFDSNVNAATVVCKMLGYTSGGHVTSNSLYGLGSGRVWLDDVICTGTESSIDDCVHLSWGSGNCGHAEDVAVKCAGTRTANSGIIALNNGTCIPNSGCALCTVMTKCDVCNSPTLGPDNNGQGSCSACRVSNCSYCGVNGADLCDRCNSGFTLSNNNSTCLECTSHCATCSSLNSCSSCTPGFYLSLNTDNSGHNTCLPCAANCKTCSQSGSDQCDTCAEGYGFYPNTHFCAPCSASNCAACSMSSSTSCDRCVDGFYWSVRYRYRYSASCESCTLANCASCDSADTCSQCQPGYVLTYYKNCITQYEYDSNNWMYSHATSSPPYYYTNYIYYTDGTMRTLAIVFGCLFGVSALIIVLFTVCKIKHMIGAKCQNRGRTINRDTVPYLTPPAYCSGTASSVYNESGPALDGLPAYDDVSSSVASGLQLRLQADNAPLLPRDEQQERRAAAYADV